MQNTSAEKFLIVIEEIGTGYSAYSPDLPGCVSTGLTRDEVERNMREAIEFHLEGMRLEGMEVPEPHIFRLVRKSRISFRIRRLEMCHIVWHNPTMASVNIRELRDTKRLKAWLRAGETVELRDRRRVIARIVPEEQPCKPKRWPDFTARQKKLFGNRVLPAVEGVIEGRGRY